MLRLGLVFWTKCAAVCFQL